VEKQSITLKTR